MALVTSSMNPLGTSAVDFSLSDTVSGETVTLKSLQSDIATVIMFICNHCPYVKHVNTQLVSVANDYIPQGVSCIAISSNDAEEYPEDGPEKMKEYAERLGYPFPYLYDETQEVGRAYGATCTPDIFVYDAEMKLAYRGRLDGSSPGNDIENDGQDLRAALDAMLAGQPIATDQLPSMGCSIKWRDD